MNILIEVRGGTVQSVTTSEDARVVILDWDTLEKELEEGNEISGSLGWYEPDGIMEGMYTMFGGPDIENKISRELKRIGF